MQLIRDLNQRRLYITEEDKTILEMGYEADEFAFIFPDDVVVPITEELDKTLYKSLNRVLDNSYEFYNNCGTQDKDIIVWLSDTAYDSDDEKARKRVNHLYIRREGNTIYLLAENPEAKEKGWPRRYKLIEFSPAGNGAFARNKETGSFFQDDIIQIYQQTLNQKVASI